MSDPRWEEYERRKRSFVLQHPGGLTPAEYDRAIRDILDDLEL